MASTYSDLKIELIGTGEQTGTWGTTTNDNFSIAIGEAITGSADVAFSSADVTITLTNTNASQAARNLRLNLTGTSGGARNLILGSGCQIEKLYLINNGLADAVTVKNTSGSGIAVPAGKTMFVYNNGTNVVDATTHLSSLTTGTLSASGATTFTAGTASTSTTTGTAVITGGLGVSGRINAANFDGIVGANTAAAGNFTTLGATGVATFSAGTVSLPAITTTGDTNTGIFFPAADTIAFTEGGVEAMRITSAGDVGIGTTSPAFSSGGGLEIERDGANATLRLQRITSTTSVVELRADVSSGFLETRDSTPLIFGTNATERMRITTAGDVGIGTGSPSTKLGVAGAISFGANITSAPAVDAAIYRPADGALALLTNSSERMRIDSAGNVGIGTSSPYSGSGVKTLQLTGSDYSLFEQSVTTATAEYQNWRQIVRGSVGGHVYQLQLMNDANSAEQTVYEVSRTANSVTYQRWYGGTSEAMRINSSGNVGIGLSNPTYRLQVAPGTYSDQLAVFNEAGTWTTNGGVVIADYYDNTTLIGGIKISAATTTSGFITFHTGGTTERMRIDTSGNVSIGTTVVSNNAKVNVLSTDATPGGIAIASSASLYRQLYLSDTGTVLQFWNGSNQANLSAAGAWTNSSDARLKKNIIDVKYGLDTVLATKPRSFERNDVEGEYVGFIAQELLPIIPEVVNGDEETQYCVDYGSLVAVAFKAIQEQQAMIENLTTRLNALEGK